MSCQMSTRYQLSHVASLPKGWTKWSHLSAESEKRWRFQCLLAAAPAWTPLGPAVEWRNSPRQTGWTASWCLGHGPSGQSTGQLAPDNWDPRRKRQSVLVNTLWGWLHGKWCWCNWDSRCTTRCWPEHGPRLVKKKKKGESLWLLDHKNQI